MISLDDLRKIDLRVARIISVEDHPSADKLYLLTIDVGGLQKKIIAGIKPHYTPQELIDKLIIVVNNLEPAVIRGIESNGMLLAASDEGIVSILAPQKPVKPGSIIK